MVVDHCIISKGQNQTETNRFKESECTISTAFETLGWWVLIQRRLSHAPIFFQQSEPLRQVDRGIGGDRK
jgi:hypothetical protein